MTTILNDQFKQKSLAHCAVLEVLNVICLLKYSLTKSISVTSNNNTFLYNISSATVLKQCLRFNSKMIYVHLHTKTIYTFGFMHLHLASIVLAVIFAIRPPPDKTLWRQQRKTSYNCKGAKFNTRQPQCSNLNKKPICLPFKVCCFVLIAERVCMVAHV